MPIEDRGIGEKYVFGATDSRSNPLNMPEGRALLCRNWVPSPGGWLEFRLGYTPVNAPSPTNDPIHTIIPFTLWTGERHLLIGADVNLYDLNLATAAWSTVGALDVTGPWGWFSTNGQIHIGTSGKVWFYDGAKLRKSGIRSLTAAEAAGISVKQFMTSYSAAQSAAVSLTLQAGGSFPADATGRTVFGAFWDLDQQVLGPLAPIGPKNGVVKFAANQELLIAGLPSTTGTRQVKLPLLTDDGGSAGRCVSVLTKTITAGSIIDQSPSVSAASTTDKPTLFASPSFSVGLTGSLPDGVTATVSGEEQSVEDTGIGASVVLYITGAPRTKSMYDPEPPPRHYTLTDNGTISLAFSGPGFSGSVSAAYGYGSTPTTLATALKNAINAAYSANLTATSSAGDLTITAVTPSAGACSVTASSRTSSDEFTGTSFPVSLSAAQFGSAVAFDTGTVSVTVGSSTATVRYGANDTAASVALALAAAINVLPLTGVEAFNDGAIDTIKLEGGGLIELTVGSHTITVDSVVGIVGSGNSSYDDKVFTVKAVGSTTIRIYVAGAETAISSGTVHLILSAGVSETSATIAAPAVFPTYIGNASSGIPASTVGSPKPGYQFYASIWNPVTGHVGNRVAIGSRLAPDARCTVMIDGFPDLSQEDSELELLLGFTIDAGEVPYALIDSGGNWLSVPSAVAQVFVGDYVIDQESEMPYRNGIPVPMNKFCMVGDNVIGLSPTDPYVRISGAADNPINPEVIGRPEQSWHPSDVLTFPTREIPLGCFEYNSGALVFSRNFSVPLYNNSGVWDFGQGFPVGICGPRGFAKTTHGPFWVTGEKQLATTRTDWVSGAALAVGPAIVSDEYGQALLGKIGDAYLDEVELVPNVDVANNKDELLIKARDRDGNVFVIVHDFNLRDELSPYGQAYEIAYTGVLAEVFTMAQGVDVNGKQRPFAGGTDGNVYQLESGKNDNGAEFDMDYMGIVNLGANRAAVCDVELWGDRAIPDQNPLSIYSRLDDSSDWTNLKATANKGEDHNFRYHNRFSSGNADLLYIRLRMTSHSADAPAKPLNDTPHFPLEDYGRIYMSRVLFGTSRGV